MNCHYVHDKIAGKVLIPGCWGTVHSLDMDDCYCRKKKNYKSHEERIGNLESEVRKLKRNG